MGDNYRKRGSTLGTTDGRAAVWQARLAMLIMINVAQLWILAAAVEAALAAHYQQLWPLIISSGICWLIALSIFLWWRPRPRPRNRPYK